jgi:hypothetical protein
LFEQNRQAVRSNEAFSISPLTLPKSHVNFAWLLSFFDIGNGSGIKRKVQLLSWQTRQMKRIANIRLVRLIQIIDNFMSFASGRLAFKARN